MRITVTHNGSEEPPFQGDLPFIIRSLPVGARVQRASVKLQPLAREGGRIFEEVISFGTGPDDEAWGATLSEDGLEVNFNARQMPVSFEYNGTLSGATVLVDAGAGTYMYVDQAGVLAPQVPDTMFPLTESNGIYPLPSIEMTRFRITPTTTPGSLAGNVEQVTIRSSYNNVNVRIGDLAPFWTHVGTMGNREYNTTNFAETFNLFLPEAEAENGFYIIPITVNSEAITRLQVDITLDYAMEKSLLPPELPEITMPYDYGDLPKGNNKTEPLRLPRRSRILAASATVQGTFEDSRIIDYDASVDIEPDNTEKVKLSRQPLAQIFSADSEILINGIDLLMTKERPGSAQIEVAIHADEDGKPGRDVLLGNQTVDIVKPPTNAPVWVHLDLSEPLRMVKQRPYWLIVQTDADDVFWRAEQQNANGKDVHALQRSESYGLAWRKEYTVVRDVQPVSNTPAAADTITTDAPAAANRESTTVTRDAEVMNPLKAWYRLRERPAAFSVPIQLRVENGSVSERHKFDNYAALGRVEFSNVDLLPTVAGVVGKIEKLEPVPDRTKNLLRNGSFSEPVRSRSPISNQVQLMGAPRYWLNKSQTITEMRDGVEVTRSGQIGRYMLPEEINGRIVAFLKARDALASMGQRVTVQQGVTYDFSFFYQTDFSQPGGINIVFNNVLTQQQLTQTEQGNSVWLKNNLVISQTTFVAKSDEEQLELIEVSAIEPGASELVGVVIEDQLLIQLQRPTERVELYFLASFAAFPQVYFGDARFASGSPAEPVDTSATQYCDGKTIPGTGENEEETFRIIHFRYDASEDAPPIKHIRVHQGQGVDGTAADPVLLHAVCISPQVPTLNAEVINAALAEEVETVGSGWSTARGALPTVEIVWLNGDGQSINGIEPIRVQLTTDATRPTDKDGMFWFAERVAPPPEAKSADFVFVQGRPGLLILDDVSLKATGEVLQNERLNRFERNANGVVLPAGWALNPSNPDAIRQAVDSRGFLNGVVLRGSDQDLDSGEIVLSQVIKAKPDCTYELKVGLAIHTNDIAVADVDRSLLPRINLIWLKEEQPQDKFTLLTEKETILEGLQGDVFTSTATSPAETTHLKIEFVQAVGDVDFQVKWLSLSQIDTMDIEFTFLSQAPGELVVRGLSVTYDPPPEVATTQQSRLLPSKVVPAPVDVTQDLNVHIVSPAKTETEKPATFRIEIRGIEGE